jgi:chitinase
MKKILLCLISLLVFAGCKKSPKLTSNSAPIPQTPPVSYVPDNSFKVVAYFPSYQDPAGVADAKYKMITHLFYAFLNPNADGSLATLSQQARFTTVINKARSNGVKVGISVSGTSSIFAQMASNSVSRTAFVNNVVNFVVNNNLDGLDMDWEYPSSSSGTDITYVSLMTELSAALHSKNKFLSAAITPGVYAGSIRDGMKAAVFPLVDFFNIMVYDGAGWDKADPFQHSTYQMAVSSLNYWLNTRGMPKEKAVLGNPSYGRNEAGTSSMSYRNILAGGGKAEKDSATVNGQRYYYNGVETIRQKAALAKSNANGVMFWEFYFDSNDNSSLLKATNDAIGRAY